jgi:O-antigen/teichoic acid export membrane protein
MSVKKSDSVAKGGSAIAFARLLGMALSFLLFLILARHSAAYAGIFRTVITYIVIAEFLGMLGLHRWLATEIAPLDAPRWSLFIATNLFTVGVSFILMLIYLGISFSGMYSAELNAGLRLGALAVIPSGIFACVQSAMMGIGQTQQMGKLFLIENVIRSGLSILLVVMNQPLIEVIWVFVLTRWTVAIYGFYLSRQYLSGVSWQIKPEIIKEVSGQAPKFAAITLGFLLLRNAGLTLLPALKGESEAAIFAVAYQLFDMMLILPSVLAMSSGNLFANKANVSDTALRKAAVHLMMVTSIAIFPFIAITAGFSKNLLMFLYGDHYLAAHYALMILMLAAGFSMVDQVLSQVMVSKKAYKQDMTAIVFGGASALVLTIIFAHYQGATGTAFALLLSFLLTVMIRFALLKDLLSFKLLLLSTWKALSAALITFFVCDIAMQLPVLIIFSSSRFLWLVLVPFALILYVLIVYLLGGIRPTKIRRMKLFLFQH